MKTSKLNIVGNGFLAKKFKKYNAFFKKKNYFIYLAGVSNSNEKKLNNLQKDFNRIKFFIENIKNSKIIKNICKNVECKWSFCHYFSN